MPEHKGLLVTLEAPEGGGKTLISHYIKDVLTKEGYSVIVSREPGGVKVAEKIREIVVHDEMHGSTEAYLYLASRAEHVQKVIKPALAEGKIVILDRFMHSSLAIQGYGRGLNVDELRRMHRLALDGIKPDLVLFLDIDPEVGLARKQGDEIQKFEREGLEFHERVYQGYKDFVTNKEMVRIDASRDPMYVLEDALKEIKNKLY